MIQARRGVFETNSSMTHSITMCMKSEYDRWESEELWMLVEPGYACDDNAPLLMNDAEMRQWLGSRLDKEYYDLGDDDVLTDWAKTYGYYKWENTPCEFIWFQDEYTTPAGETIVAFGWYGHD